jgi:hypothetical protein
LRAIGLGEEGLGEEGQSNCQQTIMYNMNRICYKIMEGRECGGLHSGEPLAKEKAVFLHLGPSPSIEHKTGKAAS